MSWGGGAGEEGSSVVGWSEGQLRNLCEVFA